MVDKKAGMRKRDEGDADVGKVYSDLGGNALDKALSDGLHEDVAAAATTGTGHDATAALVCQAIGCAIG